MSSSGSCPPQVTKFKAPCDTMQSLVLSGSLSNDEFFSSGWRIPFLASGVLI